MWQSFTRKKPGLGKETKREPLHAKNKHGAQDEVIRLRRRKKAVLKGWTYEGIREVP